MGKYSKNDIRFSSLWNSVWKARNVYMLIIPGLIWYLFFAYMPMYGLTLAFRTYKANLGIFRSPWIGFENFVYVFRDPRFFESIKTTLIINFGRLIFSFPFPILLALAINEVRVGRIKKVMHTIFTFPHFLSWVLVSGIMINFLSLDGFVNSIVKFLGEEPINFLGNQKLFLPFVFITATWKSAGWNSIIYLSAITGIDTEQYQAAEIDGASRLQRILYITLPNIMSTIAVMFILAVGRLMTEGFDQIFNMSNAAVRSVSETLDMYIYNISFRGAVDFSFSTAVSLFKSVINLLLLLLANRVLIWISGNGLFGSKEDLK